MVSIKKEIEKEVSEEEVSEEEVSEDKIKTTINEIKEINNQTNVQQENINKEHNDIKT